MKNDPQTILTETFGHAAFRASQGDVIDHVLGGGHAVVLMPTGMGKSLCYQVPALSLPGVTLVLSPLIALMKDQVDGLRAKGIDATFINSSLDRRQREERYGQVARGEMKLVYVTPERFRKPEFRAALTTARETVGIDLLAVDEAHCISQWGHDFRPDYSRVGEWRHWLGDPTTIALTATATPRVQEDILRQLDLTDDERVRQFHRGIERPNLTLDVTEAWSDEQKLEAIMEHREQLPGPGIVYFTLITTLERYSGQLIDEGVDHLCYHGKLEPRHRKRVQDEFMKGSHLVLATNAFGMGVDKADIRTITHAELPGSVESYYQEIGRSGRDGEPARCTLLYDERDLLTQMEFVRWSNPDAHFYQRVHQHLEHDGESIRAFGLDWLRERLHDRHAKHDRRLDTALAMLERHGVIEADPQDWIEGRYELVGDLPEALLDEQRLADKLKADQMRLYDLVEYVKCEDDRKHYLNAYFGCD